MEITRLIHKPLSDADIQKILGPDAKIIKYSELGDLYDIDQLLPNEKDYCIILYEDRPKEDTGQPSSNTTDCTSTSTPTASSQIASSSGSARR